MIQDDDTIPPNMRHRDPLDIVIAKEAMTCKGCGWEMHGLLWGELVPVCSRRGPDGKRHQHGKRCKDYDDKGKS